MTIISILAHHNLACLSQINESFARFSANKAKAWPHHLSLYTKELERDQLMKRANTCESNANFHFRSQQVHKLCHTVHRSQ